MAEEVFVVKTNFSDDEDEFEDFHLNNSVANDIVRDLEDMKVPWPTPEQKMEICKDIENRSIKPIQRIKKYVKENHHHHYLYYERVGWEKCNLSIKTIHNWKTRLRKGVYLSTIGVQTSKYSKRKQAKIEAQQKYTNEEFDFVMSEMVERKKKFTMKDLSKETGLCCGSLRDMMKKTNWVKRSQRETPFKISPKLSARKIQVDEQG